MADLAPPGLRGASFGLRQTLDTIGAFTGPLLAVGQMWLLANDFQAVFWIAVLPAFLSVAVLVFAVKDEAVEGLAQEQVLLLLRRARMLLGRAGELLRGLRSKQGVPRLLDEAGKEEAEDDERQLGELVARLGDPEAMRRFKL